MNKILIILCAVLLVGIGGYFLMGSPALQSGPATKEFTWDVKAKKLVAGDETMKVNKDDTVVIKITSDEAEELHVHGYDRSVELEPNKQATLTFVANASGRFPIELEESKTDLGALEVQPK